jgi:hypothetical protein
VQSLWDVAAAVFKGLTLPGTTNILLNRHVPSRRFVSKVQILHRGTKTIPACCRDSAASLLSVTGMDGFHLILNANVDNLGDIEILNGLFVPSNSNLGRICNSCCVKRSEKRRVEKEKRWTQGQRCGSNKPKQQSSLG